jgi:hypothetical protein
MKFLLNKDKEEKRKPTAQKQSCNYPALRPSLSSKTHAFFPALGRQFNNMVKVSTLSGTKTI